MKRYGIPQPDVLITSVGTEIYYAPNLTADILWHKHIDHMWQPARVRVIVDAVCAGARGFDRFDAKALRA